MSLAALGESTGVDLWHYRSADGRSIETALDYLVPFAMGSEKWPHQQIGGWQPQALYPLIRQAALKLKDPKYPELLKKLPPLSPSDRSNLLRRAVPEQLEPNE